MSSIDPLYDSDAERDELEGNVIDTKKKGTLIDWNVTALTFESLSEYKGEYGSNFNKFGHAKTKNANGEYLWYSFKCKVHSKCDAQVSFNNIYLHRAMIERII
jgi:hypothetical protein